MMPIASQQRFSLQSRASTQAKEDNKVTNRWSEHHKSPEESHKESKKIGFSAEKNHSCEGRMDGLSILTFHETLIRSFQVGRKSLKDLQKETMGLLKRCHNLEVALVLLDNMKLLNAEDVFLYTKVISLCGQKKAVQKAIDIFNEMEERAHRNLDHAPNLITYSSLITALGNAGRIDEALELFNKMEKKSKRNPTIAPNFIVYSSLITALGNAGRIDEALELFNKMEKKSKRNPTLAPDSITYTSIITALRHAKMFDQALKIFTKMEEKSKRNPTLAPDRIAYSALITALGNAGRIDEALELFNEMKKKSESNPRLAPNFILYSSLITALGDTGRIDEALELFNKMEKDAEHNEDLAPDLITYNSTIKALGDAGRNDEALELFKKMKRRNLAPNLITYNSIITACIKTKHWDEALDLVNNAIVEGVFRDSLGLTSSESGLLINFHENAISSDPEYFDRLGGVPLEVAQAIFAYHFKEKLVYKRPPFLTFIVGFHRGCILKQGMIKFVNDEFSAFYNIGVNPANEGRLLLIDKMTFQPFQDECQLSENEIPLQRNWDVIPHWIHEEEELKQEYHLPPSQKRKKEEREFVSPGIKRTRWEVEEELLS